jgi:hypothetical protein
MAMKASSKVCKKLVFHLHRRHVRTLKKISLLVAMVKSDKRNLLRIEGGWDRRVKLREPSEGTFNIDVDINPK